MADSGNFRHGDVLLLGVPSGQFRHVTLLGKTKNMEARLLLGFWSEKHCAALQRDESLFHVCTTRLEAFASDSALGIMSWQR